MELSLQNESSEILCFIVSPDCRAPDSPYSARRMATLYKTVLRPFLFALEPESVHDMAMGVLGGGAPYLRHLMPSPDPRLGRDFFGIHFPNPVGLAAGFDKSAVALLAWEGLGFGFLEAGTITARPQPGNPKPRVFRIPEHQALINRLGFNNDGADVVSSRLRRLQEKRLWPRIPVGINLGKSRDVSLEDAAADYLLSFERLHQFASYVTINVSSPNTPGLRALQEHTALGLLLSDIQRRNRNGKPILIKIAPDLEWEAIESILALVDEHRLAGIIATNTTVDHSMLPSYRRTQGGLSGAPLRQRSTEIVRFIAERTELPVIAVGGIMNADDALEKFDACASLIQLYTGFVYEGPALIRQICSALLRRG